jgi:DNA-binding transcriptional MerR regulator
MTTLTEQDPAFGIAAVSRLTGIPLDTLRVWERRYQLVTPMRSEDNKRHYSRADVARLSLIKQLVDRGHAISSVASLSEESLRERLQVHQELPRTLVASNQPSVRLLVQGDALPFLVTHWGNVWEEEGIELLGQYVSYAEFAEAALAQKPDALVIEMPAVHADRVSELLQLNKQVGAQRIIVVYGFGMKSLLERLQRNGILAIRAPVTAQALAHACRINAPALAAMPFNVEEAIPARRFDDETLSAVTQMPNSIRCECPQHLADLLFRLTAFEAYSADCENRNDQDAALHAHLHRETAKARLLLEEALDYLIRCEQIDLASLRTL